ncbi:CHC2 zinc finger domain-containing protein [Butyrivibrio sp. VCB2001]|uniref:CHC2 zinc finger domain-containing protein n=1 Tax=Butyrivibrio sp. VCB2001 TaxID=1280667 RepID=UPI0003FB5A80|nr:CHC2 zinc finger domain-containing protein [Butyrivibrio sp. VCB2001]
MNIFKSVKGAVSVMDAASFYGIKVNRSGLCNCPFHNDKTPSMKVDIRFYCFGCGATGDVIDFVGKLFGLSPLEAAKKIASDFNVITDDSPHGCLPAYSKKENNTIVQRNNEYLLRKEIDLYVRDALFILHQYREKLRTFRQDYAPKSIDGLDSCSPLFEEAIKNLNKIDWMIDELTFGSRPEQIEFINNYKGEIEHVKFRLTEIN